MTPINPRTGQAGTEQVNCHATDDVGAAELDSAGPDGPVEVACRVAQQKLRPFWRYYGGKWRAAPLYPAPTSRTIVEPFAGSAGYSLRYSDRDVVLVERYAVIAELWRYLIRTPSAEILRIPLVDDVAELPSWCPEGARHLVGFTMNDAAASPRCTISAGLLKLRAMGRPRAGWTLARREQVARHVESIRHWRVIEGDYTAAPDVSATWFVDPPYSGKAGRHYVHHAVDYAQLADWCLERRGQVIACENAGASWLPFAPLAKLKAGVNGRGSEEVVWTSSCAEPRHAG